MLLAGWLCLLATGFVDLDRVDLAVRDPESAGSRSRLLEPLVLVVEDPSLLDEEVAPMGRVAGKALLPEEARDDPPVLERDAQHQPTTGLRGRALQKELLPAGGDAVPGIDLRPGQESGP